MRVFAGYPAPFAFGWGGWEENPAAFSGDHVTATAGPEGGTGGNWPPVQARRARGVTSASDGQVIHGHRGPGRTAAGATGSLLRSYS